MKNNKIDFTHDINFFDYGVIDNLSDDLYVFSISKNGFFDHHIYYFCIDDIKEIYNLTKNILENKNIL